jgi:hypothetical protein
MNNSLPQFHFVDLFFRTIEPAFREVCFQQDLLAGAMRCVFLELAEEEARWTTRWSGVLVLKVIKFLNEREGHKSRGSEGQKDR